MRNVLRIALLLMAVVLVAALIWSFTGPSEDKQVGVAAPQIQGTDADGVAFQLSDYRGKVVLLDFWGNW